MKPQSVGGCAKTPEVVVSSRVPFGVVHVQCHCVGGPPDAEPLNVQSTCPPSVTIWHVFVVPSPGWVTMNVAVGAVTGAGVTVRVACLVVPVLVPLMVTGVDDATVLVVIVKFA